MNTEQLRDLAYAAESEEKEVYIQWHEGLDVIEYVEIDGKELLNENYKDELSDAYWLADSYRAADRSTW